MHAAFLDIYNDFHTSPSISNHDCEKIDIQICQKPRYKQAETDRKPGVDASSFLPPPQCFFCIIWLIRGCKLDVSHLLPQNHAPPGAK